MPVRRGQYVSAVDAEALLESAPTRHRSPDRERDFAQIRAALDGAVTTATERGIVAGGDSLELLRRMPDDSVSLILTDPPYHSTKKANITGDTVFPIDEDYIAWMAEYAREWHRVLRQNGSVYVFCASEMAARLEVRISEFLRPIGHITWTKPNDPGFDGWKGKMRKEALRRWYPHSERILFFEQAASGHERRSTLGSFLRSARLQSGLSGHQLTELTGAYGKVNHGGAVSNWETGRNIPSREQYAKIAAALEATGRVAPLPAYEDVVRPFFVTGDIPFVDTWDFPSVRVYRGKHPAEKPLDLLTHVIETSSYEGDIVLDCFSGSGATLEAAVSVNRRAVGMEVEPKWVDRSGERLVGADHPSRVTTLRQFETRRRQRAESPEPLF